MSHKNCPSRLKNRTLFFVITTLFLILSFGFLLSDIVYAQTSDEINLQGKIVRNDAGYEGLNVVTGTPTCVASGADTCDFQVKYYSASAAGTLYLTETFSDVEIGDYGGVFNLPLGTGSFTTTSECDDGTCNTPDEVIKEFTTLYIEIGFAPGGAGSYTEVFTRTELNASPYAIRSEYAAGSVPDSFKFHNSTNSTGITTTTGSVYYDSTDSELKLYDGSGWVSIGGGLWETSNVGTDYTAYMSATGIGTFDNFSLDIDDDRVSINSDQMEGGLSVYSSYSSTGGYFPLVSFKSDSTNYQAPILHISQVGHRDGVDEHTAQIIQGYTGSTLSFEVDNSGDVHLANDGVLYFENFAAGYPTNSELYPRSNEGCVYAYGGDIYWDSACNGTAEEVLNGGTASSLWTDGGTFTYLTDTSEDLVLGASATSGAPFFFDVSAGRLGLGTDTPQAAIDIAGASSTISNSTGDITISPNEDLNVTGDTYITGNLYLSQSGADSYIKLTSDEAGDETTAYIWTEDAVGLTFGSNTSTPHMTVEYFSGDVGIGTGTALPDAQLDIEGDSDQVQLKIKGYSTQTADILQIVKSDTSELLTLENSGLLTLSGNFQGGTNNTYDIGSTSTRWQDVYAQGNLDIGANGDSGSIRYNTTNDELEFTNDGSTWIPMAGATTTEVLSSEYAGAVMSADGSSNTGSMTSDAEGSGSNSMNYYEWNSSETTLQDYDVRVRYTIPSDFDSWGTNAFTLNYATEANSSTNNKVDIYVYLESSGTVDDSSTGQYSSSAGVWTTTNIQGADLGDCNAAGETCLLLIRMYSANDSYTRIGDIDVNYNRKL